MKVVKKKRLGQSMLEFALVLPMLLGLLLILFDLGRVTYYYSSINNAAREGARYGIVLTYDVNGDFNKGAIEAAAVGSAYGVTGGEVTALADLLESDTVVRVRVSFTFIPATPLVANLIGAGPGITLNSQAQMLVE